MFDKELVNANPNTLAWHQKCARIGPYVTTWQLYFLLLYLNLSLSHSGLFINPEHAVHALVTWPLLIPSTCFKIPLRLSTYINPTHFKRMAVVHFLHEIFAYYLNPWIALSLPWIPATFLLSCLVSDGSHCTCLSLPLKGGSCCLSTIAG